MTKYINDKLKKPNLFLFFAIVSSAIILISGGIQSYNIQEDLLENSAHSQKIRARVSNIRFWDEVLTNSTLLAVSTGDSKWEKRYRYFEPKLDSAVNELLQIDPLHATFQTSKMTDSANVHLMAMEHRVFELIHLNRRNEAYEIITGNEYARQKAIYSEGLSSFIKLHELETDQLQTRLRKAATQSKWSFGLVILLFTIVWLPIERYLRKSRAQMLRQNQELELQIQARKASESALYESKKQIEKAQEQLQESIKASGVGLWDWNMQTNEVYQSPEWKKQIGYEDDELQSSFETYISHLHPNYTKHLEETTNEFISGKRDKSESEYRFRHKDGSYRWILARASVQYDENGKPWHLLGSNLDITERKNAEQLIRELNERFNLIARATNDCVYDWDMLTGDVWWNPALSQLFGYSPEIITTDYLWWEEKIHPDDLDSIMQVAQKMFDEQLENWSGEYRFKRADGSYAYVFDRTIVIYDKDKTPIRWIGSVMDITERKNTEEKLKESEENYRILAESSPEMIYLIDAKGYVTYMNKVAAAQFRTPAQELVGKHLKDIFPPDLTQQNLANIQDVISTKRSFQNEVEMVFPTGNRWVDARLTPIFDEKDQVTGVLGLSYDITERKKSEEKIKLLAHAVKNSGDCIIIINKDHHIVFVNDSFCKVYGYREEEIIGQLIPVIISGNNLSELENDLFSTIAKKKIWTGEVLHKRKDGNDFPVQLSLAPLLNNKGELIAYVAVLRDITERKQAEEALRASQQLIEGIINTISVRVFWKDKNLVYLGCNKIFARDAGFSDPKDIIGKDDFQMGWLDQAELYRSGDRQVMESGIPILLNEEPQTTPEGETIILLTNKLPLQNSMGEIIGILGTYMDITDRKRTEDEIKLKNEELQKLITEKDKFFSIIAHDLRGPVGGIMGLTEMIADESNQFTSDQKKNMTLTLSHSARNIFNLLENLLEWSQMQKGNIEFNPQLHVLKEVVNHCMKTIAESARKKHIEIVVNISNEQKVFVDTNMLQTIIRNLASNAIKFTPKGGIVTITGKVGEESIAIISVKDTGIGMSREMLDNLFRLDVNTGRKGTDGEPSTGLGLLLCKEFVEKHGGSLWAESEEGKGSVFYFTLPFLKVAKENIVVDNVVSTDRAAVQIKKLKILIAEDDETSDMLFTIALSNISRDLLHAKTGVEAVDICRKNPDIDLLLMDIQMPGMDGYEATRQIRLFNKDIVIFVQTAFAFVGEKEKSIEAGCNDYISKPIDSASLMGLIQEHFKKTGKLIL